MTASRRALLRTLLASFAVGAAPLAQTLTTETVADGFDRPVWCGSPPNDDRIFVLEQNTGLIRIIDATGTVLPTPFLDIGDKIIGGFEMGLLSMAFHPKYSQNGTFFLTYVIPTEDPINDQISVVSRMQVDATDPDLADEASEVVLMEVLQFTQNHNVMHLDFSPVDGYLYIGSGDGGGSNGPSCLSQDLSRLEGKFLRIDVDGQDPGLEYAIPPDNPYVGVAGAREEIWSIGHRNPWRFSFDPFTGDMIWGDVQESTREEVNLEPALASGRNYGWPTMESDICNVLGDLNCVGVGLSPGCFAASLTDPIYAHDNPPDEQAAIIGGVVYRGCVMPELQGTYVFGEKGLNEYYSMEIVGGVATNFQDRTAELDGQGRNPVHFGTDRYGEILIAEFAQGRVRRIVPATPVPPVADCNGNGLEDACENATWAHVDTNASGTPDACESFHVDQAGFCVSLGDRQSWFLHPGAAFAGDAYFVLGSFSGTSPGVDFGTALLPLNFDPYMNLAVATPNQVPFVGSLGFLDGNGEAEAAFFVPAALPPVITGLTAAHAYLVFGPANQVLFASNYTTLTFEP